MARSKTTKPKSDTSSESTKKRPRSRAAKSKTAKSPTKSPAKSPTKSKSKTSKEKSPKSKKTLSPKEKSPVINKTSKSKKILSPKEKSPEIKKTSKSKKTLSPKEKSPEVKKTSKSKKNPGEVITHIETQLAVNYAEQQKLMQELRDLMKNNDVKIDVQRRQRRLSPKYASFNKPEHVPKKIAELLGLEPDEELPRSKVIKLLYDYMTENRLYDSKKKTKINPNRKLRRALGMNSEDGLDFYDLQLWVKKAYER